MFIDILVIAMIAVFLVYRLRSVLGRRTGNEQQRPNPFGQSPARQGEVKTGDTVVALPERPLAGSSAEPRRELSGRAGGLTQVKIADPSFSERGFLDGARVAFGMIVEAYANGDTATLRPLLSDQLYDEFSAAIRERLANRETLETSIESIDAADIVEARMDGRTALVTVRFVSRQINVTRNEQGEVIDGDPTVPTKVTDLWTFARNTRTTDPNWTLVETATPNETPRDAD